MLLFLFQMCPAAQETQLRYRLCTRKRLIHQAGAALEQVTQRDGGNSISGVLCNSPVAGEKLGLRCPEIPCKQKFYDSVRYWQQDFFFFLWKNSIGGIVQQEVLFSYSDTWLCMPATLQCSVHAWEYAACSQKCKVIMARELAGVDLD